MFQLHVNTQKLNPLLLCTALFSSVFVVVPASALDFTVDLQFQAAAETNALNNAVNEQDDVGLSYGLALGFEHRENYWDVGGEYTVNYIDYSEDLNQDETLFTGTSDFVWRPKPGFFEWSFTHARQNERRNVLEPDVPDNREVRDVITTQPVLFFKLGSGDKIITSARYVIVDQETANNNDSERWGASIGWQRQLTQVSTFSVNSEYSQVDFEADGADYDSARLFVDYSANLRALDYSIQVGGANISPELGDDFTGEYVRVEGAVRQDVHIYSLVLLSELTDTSLALSDVNFALNIDNRATNSVEVFDGASIVTQRQAILTYQGNVLCQSCTITASTGFVNLDYESEERDQRNLLASAALRYDYTPAIAFGFGVDYQDSEIDQLLGTSTIEELTFTGQLEWQLSRRLAAMLSYSHEVQDGTNDVPGALLVDPNFDNDTITLAVSYRLW